MAHTHLARVLDQVKRAAEEDAVLREAEERQRATQEELDAAWATLSPNGHSLSRAEAVELLQLTCPWLTRSQLKELVPHGITKEALQQLLITDPPAGVDVAAGGFRVLDPNRTGKVDPAVLQHLMARLLKLPKLGADELQLLLQVADMDGDGAIQQQDFLTLRKRQAASGISGIS